MRIVLEAEAEAEAVALKGEAEAFAIEAKAKAEAEQMNKKAEAFKEYKEAAMIDMMLKVKFKSTYFQSLIKHIKQQPFKNKEAKLGPL